jgi:Asp-tRNA(Asn)/Glu-tRNA(Gln) amidotransferase A subunit family amidase
MHGSLSISMAETIDICPAGLALPRSLEQLSTLVASGEYSPVEAVEQCLERIHQRESKVQAWAYLAGAEARSQAQQLTQELLSNGPRSPLHGIPFGVKDIYDTNGVPTEWGTPVHKGRIPTKDAALVTQLKKAGAIVLGKTHTTAYAYFDPAPTRNPHNLVHTPGGSSSGSAAAVADGMIPFALGSQTQGSVLRPASFCGVTGFKPSYGRLPVEGIMPFAPTLDHPGVFTRTVEDMVFLWTAMRPYLTIKETFPQQSVAIEFAVPSWPIKGTLDFDMRSGFEAYVASLHKRGFHIAPIDLPESLMRLPEITLTVMHYEAAKIHGDDFRRNGVKVGHKLALLIEDGLTIHRSDYQSARDALEQARIDFKNAVGERIWITPAAIGAAPDSIDTTGDPCCNSPFTTLGAPSISIPFATASDGLPLGLQLASAQNGETRLLTAATQLTKN